MNEGPLKAKWEANASATLVGSMPHKDRQKVIELILREMPEIPVWPQLCVFEPEQMMLQYIEGLPGIQLSEGRLFLQTDTSQFEEELYAFYEEYIAVETEAENLMSSRFQMGDETGRTFFEFLKALERLPPSFRALKGQVVGPFTLLSGLKDQNDRALLYDERLQDVVPKLLAMKARWQIRKFKSFGRPVIVFLDEPALAGFGSSAFISVSRELVQQLLKELVDAIHEEDALAGIHICANTDWLLAFQSGADIINFDSYNYLEKFALFREAFSRFMRAGHIVAWGLVPTGDTAVLQNESASSLANRWLNSIGELTGPDISISKILSQSLFTPSCGCGSLPEPVAERVVSLTRELSLIMQNQLGSA